MVFTILAPGVAAVLLLAPPSTASAAQVPALADAAQVPAATVEVVEDAVPVDPPESEPGPLKKALEDGGMSPDDGEAYSEDGRSLWKTVGLNVARMAAVVAGDVTARSIAQNSRSEAKDRVFDPAHRLGDWQFIAPFYAAGIFGVGAALDGVDGLKAGGAMITGVLAGSLANSAVNNAVGRQRPRHEEGTLSFSPFSGHASFPSGHTAFTFSLAGAIDEATEGLAPALAAYSVAGLVGVSRVYHDDHWLSDVAAGALVGTMVSRMTTRKALVTFGVRDGGDGGDDEYREERRFDPYPPGHRKRGVSVGVVANHEVVGVRLSF